MHPKERRKSIYQRSKLIQKINQSYEELTNDIRLEPLKHKNKPKPKEELSGGEDLPLERKRAQAQIKR